MLPAPQLRSLRHAFRRPRSRRTCWSGNCGCATCWRPMIATAISALPIARIVEVTPDRRIVLDERWIPPALTCTAVPQLAALVVETGGPAETSAARGPGRAADRRRHQKQHRGRGLPAAANRQRLANPACPPWRIPATSTPRRCTESCCRWQASSQPSPTPRRRPNTYAAYRHYDLQRSLAPRDGGHPPARSRPVLEQTAIRVPLQERRARRARRPDPGPHAAGRVELRAGGASRRAGRHAAAQLPEHGQDRRGRAYPRVGQRRAARHRAERAAGGAAANAVRLPARSTSNSIATAPHWQQMQSSGGFAVHVSRGLSEPRPRPVGDTRLMEADMSDNPFAEPGDDDRHHHPALARRAPPPPGPRRL